MFKCIDLNEIIILKNYKFIDWDNFNGNLSVCLRVCIYKIFVQTKIQHGLSS